MKKERKAGDAIPGLLVLYSRLVGEFFSGLDQDGGGSERRQGRGYLTFGEIVI